MAMDGATDRVMDGAMDRATDAATNGMDDGLDSIRIPLCADTLEGVLMEMNISQAVCSPHGVKQLDKRS